MADAAQFTEQELESVSPWAVALLTEARIQKDRLRAVRPILDLRD